MDLYQRLRVASTASQLEIDRAYQQMVKEAGYDTSIDRKDVEAAYRTLGDPTRRALYDAAQLEERKKRAATEKVQLKIKKAAASNRNRTIGLVATLVVLILLAGLYLPWRYGNSFNTFDPGDSLALRSSGKYFGRVIKEESSHNFGSGFSGGAYLVDTGKAQVWFPARDIQALCEKKSN
jgi:curved DNA-binding protein CbpA